MKTIDFENISNKLRSVRVSKGLTQEYVANIADVNTTHICNIENHRTRVSLPTLIAICNALDVTVDYILSDEYVGKDNQDTPLDFLIQSELKSCDKTTKERILEIIRILK